ncbi:MAG TPA: UDP-N-acetylglucosamine 1-carboxyvinyltransferase [Verrucomicrobiae bacterium]|nr:UDP-N-acetylglucosamine 1-carboxyvinyltransferase [Verrucomicrobiae bacterium]
MSQGPVPADDERLLIRGGRPLRGQLTISGSKNAALPEMVAALLTPQPLRLRNVPEIEDVDTMTECLHALGVRVERSGSGCTLEAAELRSVAPPAGPARRMRASFLLLGALLARAGEARVPLPGGDDIGLRRVEQHIEGLRAMGAVISETDAGEVVAHASRLHGAHIRLDMPTVTGTENLMMAAVTAEGITVLSNAAREPHVVDLALCLRGMGARIDGAGSDRIVIEGVEALHGSDHAVRADYLEAGTFAFAAAATGGDVELDGLVSEDLGHVLQKLRLAGCVIEEGEAHLRVSRPGPLLAVDMTTWPHPGFATDLQAPYVALMTQATGTAIVSEFLFENRFRHVGELVRLGARVSVDGRSAIICGPSRLAGAWLTVPDIRSGAALVIAGLCAEGTTECSGLHHLDRGYQDLGGKLRQLGADLERRGGSKALGHPSPSPTS